MSILRFSKTAAVITIVLTICFNTTWATIEGDTIEYKIEGTIISKSGQVVKMKKTDGVDIPQLQTEGTMSKYFETELFGGTVTGWMEIGRMKLAAISGDQYTFSLLEELSVVIENGQKKNHFEAGKKVKFTWRVAVAADEAAFKLGMDAVDDEDLETASEKFHLAINLNPSNHKAYNMLGVLEKYDGDLDSAVYYFLEALKIEPDNPQYLKNISITYYNQSAYSDAYSNADKMVKNAPDDPEAFFIRSITNFLANKGSITETIQNSVMADINKAIELDPEYSYYFNQRAFLKNEFGDKAGACEDAKKCKSMGGKNADDLVEKYCN